VINALRERFLLKELLVILNMAKSSYCYQESLEKDQINMPLCGAM